PAGALPRARLGPRGGARARAAVPARVPRDPARGKRRARQRHPKRRAGVREVERHVRLSQGAPRTRPTARRRADRGGARRRPPALGRGRARMTEVWWISLVMEDVIVNLDLVVIA